MVWGPNMLLTASGEDPSFADWTTTGTVATYAVGTDDNTCFKLLPHSSMTQVITGLINVPSSFQFMFSTCMATVQTPDKALATVAVTFNDGTSDISYIPLGGMVSTDRIMTYGTLIDPPNPPSMWVWHRTSVLIPVRDPANIVSITVTLAALALTETALYVDDVIVDYVLNDSILDYVRAPGYATTTGSANTYLISTIPPLAALDDGVSIYANINDTNTGSSTLNWDGTGAKPIVDASGVALIAGALLANTITGFRYNASTASFQLLAKGGAGGGTISPCPKTNLISLDYTGSGVTIAKDGVLEVWTWVIDINGFITGMSSNKGRMATAL